SELTSAEDVGLVQPTTKCCKKVPLKSLPHNCTGAGLTSGQVCKKNDDTIAKIELNSQLSKLKNSKLSHTKSWLEQIDMDMKRDNLLRGQPHIHLKIKWKIFPLIKAFPKNYTDEIYIQIPNGDGLSVRIRLNKPTKGMGIKFL
ncbi:unnamed protein product, partial [Hymenolepis diminuta]